MDKKIGIIVGSLRKESFNRLLALELMRLAPPSVQCEIVEIADLPLYNQDFDDEGRPPKEWVDFRQRISPLNGILFVTPEYNRSIPAPLKNAIDVGSRPYGASVWSKKPCAVMSASPGAIGGFGANQHIRQTFVFLDMPCMQMPEAYIGNVHTLFDKSGALLNEKTKEFLDNFMKSFVAWVDRF